MNTMIESSNLEEVILDKLRSLPSERQQEVLDFVEFLSTKEVANPRRSVKGMLSDLNIKISKAEIDEARREAWCDDSF